MHHSKTVDKSKSIIRLALVFLLCIGGVVLFGCGGPLDSNSANSEQGSEKPLAETPEERGERIAANRERNTEIENSALLMTCFGGAGVDAEGEDCGFSQAYAIMENGDVYSISFSSYLDTEKNTSDISLIATLGSKDLEQIESFIEENRLLSDEFEDYVIMDAFYELFVNKDGLHVGIRNHQDLTNEARTLIMELLGREE